MMSSTGHLPRLPYFFIAAGVLIADQATKLLADRFLRGGSGVEVVPGFFDLVYSRNRGGLFGYFGELADPWRAVLLTAFPLLAVAMIAWFILRGNENDRPTLVGLGLILGGATGNLIDRLIRGEVVDFLDVYVSARGPADWLVARFGTAHWPTFNVADSGIVAGACLLVLTLFRRDE
jgi:signal peptidase II